MRYAQIIIETGAVIGDSHLSGQVDRTDMIPIADDFDLTHKRYVNGEWITFTPKPSEPQEEPEEEVSEQDLVNAEILLNQAEILSNQNATDEVLAEILLNQVTALSQTI